MATTSLKSAAAATSFVLLGAGSAFAADLGPYPRPREPALSNWQPKQIERWTGFYMGGTYGYGWGTAGVEGTSNALSFDQSGGLGTLFAGYNWQRGSTVLGLEADIGTGSLGGSATTIPNNATLRAEMNSFGSLRARAGILTGPALLIYATGGFAWADMDFKLNNIKAQSTLTGYQLGAGAEMMIAPQWTLRLEYLYTDLDKATLSHHGATNTYDPDFHTVRAGVAFKF